MAIKVKSEKERIMLEGKKILITGAAGFIGAFKKNHRGRTADPGRSRGGGQGSLYFREGLYGGQRQDAE